jgi:NAD(P)-dependent dehydrogenase (short-subunit alcohol dehydrogenase family)
MSLRRPTYDVAGRVVLITGAAQGIGLETARHLAARGARLVLLDIDEAGLHSNTADLPDAFRAPCDVTDARAVGLAVEAAVAHFGSGIDVVIANAGIAGHPAPVGTMEPSMFERIIEVNVLGVWRTVRAALPHMSGGYILVVASLAALVPLPFDAPYAASKGAVEQFGRSLAIELQYTGIKVGVAYFGFIKTPMVDAVFSHPGTESARRAMPGFLREPAPVGDAAEAIVRGIETRARTAFAPRWLGPLFGMRHLAAYLTEIGARRRGVRAPD